MKRLIYLIVALVFLAGCRTQYVPIIEKHIEYRDRLSVDSIYNSDTTYYYLNQDTIILETIKWRNRYQLITDSVVRVDSIPYPVEVIEYVNKLTKWQSQRLMALNILIAILGLFGVYRVSKFLKFR